MFVNLRPERINVFAQDVPFGSSEVNTVRCFGAGCRGRADPFALLVLGVLMALSVTVVIQAQASLGDDTVVTIDPTVRAVATVEHTSAR